MQENEDNLDIENELKRQKNLEEWEEESSDEESSIEEEEDNSARNAGFLTYFLIGRDGRKIIESIAILYVFYLLIRLIIYGFQKLFRIKVDEEKLPDFTLLKNIGILLGTIFLVYIVAWLIIKFT